MRGPLGGSICGVLLWFWSRWRGLFWGLEKAAATTKQIKKLHIHPMNIKYKPAELVVLQSEVPKPAVPTVVCCSILFKEGVDIVASDCLYLNTQPSCHIISTAGLCQNTCHDSCCGDLYLHNYLFSKVKVSLQSWGWVLPFLFYTYSTYRHSFAVVGFLTSKAGHTRYPNDLSIFLKGTFSIS